MALNATIYRAKINLTDLERNLFTEVHTTIAKHPSENEQRMMYRLLAYLYCYEDRLEFTKGISSTDEPDIWLKDYSGEITHWIELGFPDLKRMKQALSRANKVTIFTYQFHRSSEWFSKLESDIRGLEKLAIYFIKPLESRSIEELAQKSMDLSLLIQDGLITLSNESENLSFEFICAKASAF